jgi:hypothetical protein
MPTVRATNPNLLPKKLPTYPKVKQSKPLKGRPTLLGGFEWTASSVAKWTAGNLASGVVGAAGGMLFGKALDAIGLGEPDLAKMLTDISNRLIGIENELRATKQLTEQILQELRELRVTMDQSFAAGPLKDAFTKIDTAYGTAPALKAQKKRIQGGKVSAPSLMELLNSLSKTETPARLKEYADAFVDAEQNVWQITTQIQAIHNVLATRVGEASTVLEAWADGLILAVKSGKLSLAAASRTLEGYFMQAIGKQVTAVSMHCFALGKETSRIDYFMKTDFGAKMRAQTDEYLRCIEKLVFSPTTVKKVPSTFTMQQSGEFHADAESILLRADLICASLNLVSNTRKVNSLKEAISGAYGRVLARKSDMGADGKGPKMILPGLTWINGRIGGKLDNLHVVDLTLSGNTLSLGSYEDSSPTLIRYYWPWKTLPAEGKPLEPVFRGDVTPRYYDVFEDKNYVLAAGFLDFRTLLVGAPGNTPPTLTKNTDFPPANSHAVINQKTFKPHHPHPLAGRPPVAANTIEWRFDHAWKWEGTRLRSSTFSLFKYSGGKAKLRITANVSCSVEHLPKCPTWGDNDCNARLNLVEPGGGEKLFYNSENDGDGRLALIHRRGNYKAKLESWPTIEIELSPGSYALSLDFKSWVGYRTPVFEYYDGWNLDSLHFELNGLYVEWV